MYHLWGYRNIAGVLSSTSKNHTDKCFPKRLVKGDQSMISLDGGTVEEPGMGAYNYQNAIIFVRIIGVINLLYSLRQKLVSVCERLVWLWEDWGGREEGGHYWLIGGSPPSSDKREGWTKAFAFSHLEKSITGESLEMHNGVFSAFCLLSYENSDITLFLLLLLKLLTFSSLFSWVLIAPSQHRIWALKSIAF